MAVGNWTMFMRQFAGDNTIRVDEVTPDQARRLAAEGWQLYGRGSAATYYRPGTYPGYSGGNANSPQGPGTGGVVTPGGDPNFNNDAFEFVRRQFAQWGLTGLESVIRRYLEGGYSADTVSLMLQETPEYKARFAANEKRRAAGLPVLSPAEYLSVEAAYREIMSAAGLPPGFYDQPSDFTKWIEADVSPAEIKQRVDVAAELVNSIDPATRSTFEQWYTKGDMVAYALDRKRATTVLERQYRAAQIGGAAQDQGIGVDRGLAERVAETGLSAQQARAGFASIAEDLPTAQKLGNLYGEQYGQQDLVEEVFFSNAKAADKRKRLASRERAQFSGRSGVSDSSLSRSDAGGL